MRKALYFIGGIVSMLCGLGCAWLLDNYTQRDTALQVYVAAMCFGFAITSGVSFMSLAHME